MKDQISVTITKEDNLKTIIEFLKSFYVGKAKIEEIRNKKSSFINGTYAPLETKLKEGDKLSFSFEEEINFKPLDRPLNVLYEDDEILIVNKESKILIHPDNPNKVDTLVNIVANYYLKNNIHREVRYIHRIDYETSGIVVFAKDFLTFCKLNKEIETHEIRRKYLALCEGIFSKKQGEINFSIGRDRHNAKAYRVSTSSLAKEAITFYEVVKTFQNMTLVKCILKTGRTHQIRVHMSYLNHPLLGDTLYGGKKDLISRVALHSYHVSLINPITKKKIEVEGLLPNDMRRVIDL